MEKSIQTVFNSEKISHTDWFDNPDCRLLPMLEVHANFGKELQKCNWPKAVQQGRGWLLVFSA